MSINAEGLASKAAKDRKPNKDLIRRLKRWKRKALDQKFEEIHDAVFDTIDCLDCGNCCRHVGPRLINPDIQRIAKHLNMKASKFVKFYLEEDEDGDRVFKESPCPFLDQESNYCAIYEVRPKACAEYPHTDMHNMPKHLSQLLPNSSACPAVYEILRRLREEGV